MGMVLNRFDMFEQIRKDLQSGKSIFGISKFHFVLTGVIVHNPLNVELKSHIQNNMITWSQKTGDNFLFITFVAPNEEWKRSEIAKAVFGGVKTEQMVADKFSNQTDEKQNDFFLRDFFGLQKDGDFLLLTTNLASEDFKIIPISIQSIDAQLDLITEYCNNKAQGGDIRPKDFQQLLGNLGDLIDGHLNSPFIDILSDISSFSFSKRRAEWENEGQMNRFEEMVQRQLDGLQTKNEDDIEEFVMQMCQCIMNVFNKSHNRHRRANDCLDVDPSIINMLDRYSYELYNSFRSLKSVVESRNQQAEACMFFEYSGLTIYLGKIVENEVNLSVVQMLRYVSGIDMPQYFNKPCPRNRSMPVQTGLKNVYLNNSRMGDDYTIPIGDVVCVYRVFAEYPDSINLELDMDDFVYFDDSFLDFLEDFCKNYRNQAGHKDSNSLRTFHGAEREFNNYLNNYQSMLYSLRQSLLAPKKTQ